MTHSPSTSAGLLADELLPCPFCGGEGLTHRAPGGWRVSCKNCDCQPRPGIAPETKAEAIAAWNTRQSAAPASEAGEVADARGKLTPEYVGMTPLQKWETLALHGLLGTDEPWIADMRETLCSLSRPSESAETVELLASALGPFARYCELNDLLDSRDPDRAIEVPVSDLQRAHALLAKLDAQGGSGDAE